MLFFLMIFPFYSHIFFFLRKVVRQCMCVCTLDISVFVVVVRATIHYRVCVLMVNISSMKRQRERENFHFDPIIRLFAFFLLACQLVSLGYDDDVKLSQFDACVCVLTLARVFPLFFPFFSGKKKFPYNIDQ